MMGGSLSSAMYCDHIVGLTPTHLYHQHHQAHAPSQETVESPLYTHHNKDL